MDLGERVTDAVIDFCVVRALRNALVSSKCKPPQEISDKDRRVGQTLLLDACFRGVLVDSDNSQELHIYLHTILQPTCFFCPGACMTSASTQSTAITLRPYTAASPSPINPPPDANLLPQEI